MEESGVKYTGGCGNTNAVMSLRDQLIADRRRALRHPSPVGSPIHEVRTRLSASATASMVPTRRRTLRRHPSAIYTAISCHGGMICKISAFSSELSGNNTTAEKGLIVAIALLSVKHVFNSIPEPTAKLTKQSSCR